jgi:integrase
MSKLSPKSVNNALTCLSMMLKKAAEWGVIDDGCKVKHLKVTHDEAPFYDFVDYENVLEAARKFDERLYVATLLGGDAGLRMGEVIGLDWTRVNFLRGVLVVAQSEWRGHVTPPKGGRIREVKMTLRLQKALKELRNLRGERVLLLDDGSHFNRETLRKWTMRAQRAGGLHPDGAFHIFRHTFCAHLAMRGAPAKAIQELAGHADLTTTMRYMHLSPAARDSAIALLDAGHAEHRQKSVRSGT